MAAKASCPRRKPLPAIFAMRVWPFHFQAMAPQKVSPGGDPKNILNVTLNVVLDGVSLVKKLP